MQMTIHDNFYSQELHYYITYISQLIGLLHISRLKLPVIILLTYFTVWICCDL